MSQLAIAEEVSEKKNKRSGSEELQSEERLRRKTIVEDDDDDDDTKMSEDEQLENKKQIGDSGSESESESEENQPEVDDHYWLFDKEDSDGEDGFETGASESGHDLAPMVKADVATKRRRCLQADVCNVFQHKQKFRGLPFVELFKVTLIFNDKCESPNEPFVGSELYGEIVTLRRHHYVSGNSCYDDSENPFDISYYTKKHTDTPDIVNLGPDNKYFRLPLSDPKPRPPIHDSRPMAFEFALRIDGQDMFTIPAPHVSPDVFGPDTPPPNAEMLSFGKHSGLSRDRSEALPFILRAVLGNPYSDRILLSAKYAAYHGAWATVEVKLMKEEGFRNFYGVIMARPCIFYSRFRLLDIQPGDKPGVEVDGNSNIKLTRSVMAVPSYSSLVIGAELFDQQGMLLCRGSTFFPAKESGSKTKIISYNAVETLRVTVRWECNSFLGNGK